VKNSRLFLILLLTVSVCITSYQLLVNRCLWWNCAPERDFTLFDLNLPSEIFPLGSDIRELQPDRDYPSIEEAATTNRWETGDSIYILRRFPSSQQAVQRFNSRTERNIFTQPELGGENTQVIKEFQSSIANYFKLECGYFFNDFRCVYWACYEEYYIYFSASVGETDLEPETFFEAITYIDSRMGELLGK
jgi:hypothetical protein